MHGSVRLTSALFGLTEDVNAGLTGVLPKLTCMFRGYDCALAEAILCAGRGQSAGRMIRER